MSTKTATINTIEISEKDLEIQEKLKKAIMEEDIAQIKRLSRKWINVIWNIDFDCIYSLFLCTLGFCNKESWSKK